MGKLTTVLKLQNVEKVEIQGIEFMHSMYDDEDGWNFHGQSLIQILNCNSVQIHSCHFSHAAASGVYISGSFDINVAQNIFYDTMGLLDTMGFPCLIMKIWRISLSLTTT